MDKENFFIKSQIEISIQQVIELINTNVFTKKDFIAFREPVFVSMILKLDDLLQKFRILGHRLNFNDDISTGDITDLVNNIRNAICHLNSGENLLDKKSQLKFVFCMLLGKANGITMGENIIAKSDYEDDIAFFYGENRIYLKRHIIRILNEVQEVYKKLYN